MKLLRKSACIVRAHSLYWTKEGGRMR